MSSPASFALWQFRGRACNNKEAILSGSAAVVCGPAWSKSPGGPFFIQCNGQNCR